MPEVKRNWRLNGLIKPLAPAPLVEQSIEYDLPDGWHGLANGITLPRGRKYGVANFLVAQSDLSKLSGRNTIDCYHDGGTTTWRGWYVESWEAVTKQENPAYWVRLVDPRWLLERSSSEGWRYNLRKSSTDYVTASTMGGTPYTWTQVISDLWSLLPSQAGSVPTLPRTPPTTPENLYFDGVSAWRAVNQVLTAIGLCVVYDPFQGVIKFVDLTTPQTISYPSHLLFNARLGGGDLDLPELAGVLYHWLPNDASYVPFRKAPYYDEGTIGGEQGTYEIVDTTFMYEGRNLTARTNEIADALGGLLDAMSNPVDKTYSGVWEQLPGSRLSEMRWTSDGYRGFETRAIYDFEEFEWPQLPPYDNGRKNWIGFLYASYRGVVAGFWVVPTIALDGPLPDGPQWVWNIYKWNFGIAGFTIRVEEDPENQRWLALQQEYICPDGRTIDPPPPPPPADPPPYPYPE